MATTIQTRRYDLISHRSKPDNKDIRHSGIMASPLPTRYLSVAFVTIKRMSSFLSKKHITGVQKHMCSIDTLCMQNMHMAYRSFHRGRNSSRHTDADLGDYIATSISQDLQYAYVSGLRSSIA